MTQKVDRQLSRIEVLKKAGLASATLDYLMEKGAFPQPCNPYAEVDLWHESEVKAWVYSRRQAALAAGHGR